MRHKKKEGTTDSSAGPRQRTSGTAGSPRSKKNSNWFHEDGLEILEALMQKAPFGLMLLDKQGNCIYTNPEFTHLTGYSDREAQTGRQWFRKAFPEASLRHELLLVWRKTVLETNADHDCPVRCRDGKTKQIRFRRTVLKDGRSIILLSDMTQLMESEDRRRTAQDRFLAAIEFLPDATVVIDRNKRIVAWNKAIEEMSGKGKSEMLGRGDYAYSEPFYGEPRPMLIDLVGTPDEEIEATYTAVKRRGSTLFGENYLPSLNGGKGAHCLGAASFLYDSDGRVVGSIESIKDISDHKKTEEDLRFANTLLLTQQETSPDGILVVDEEARIISYNHRFVDMWGIPEEVLESRSDERALRAVLDKMRYPDEFIQKVSYLYEHRREISRDQVLLADGRVFDRYSAPMFGSGERYYGRVWYFRDMTEYKEAQDALRESEEKFRSVFEQSNVGLAICSLSGEILSVNNAFMDMVGYSLEELQQMTYEDLTPVKWHDLERGIVQDQVITNGDSCTYHKEYIRKDGSILPVGIRTWVTRDAQGQLQYLMGWVQDITERLRAEEALREREETFRALAENSPDTIVRLDRQCRHLYANHKIEILTGIPVHTFIGKTGRELGFPEVLCELLETGVAAVFSTGTVQRRESQLPTGVWVDWLLMPERDADGTVKAVVAAARDITELKEAEAEHARTNDRLSAWVQELEDNSRDAAILSEMADFLQTCRTTEEAYKVVAHSAKKLFPADSGAVCAVSPSRNIVEAVSVWGSSFDSERVFAPHDCWALRRGKAHHVPDIQAGLLCDHLGQAPEGGYLCVPMMAHGETLGVLHVRTESMRYIEGPVFERLTESKRRLAVAMAEHIALALANLRLRETLHRQAIRDPLTGLYNRRHMEESLEREVHRALRGETPLSVIMLDLDHFKQFNDTFGHSAGDTLLQELGVYFQENIRGEDLACRFGGEEFVLILPDASAEDAALRMEELLSGMNKLRPEHRGQPLAATTFSAGVASLPRHGSTVDALLQSADRALYRAKILGRKRVVIADAHLSLKIDQDDTGGVAEARQGT